MYNNKDECLNCGAHISDPHNPDCLNNVVCGDCLQVDCIGCE